MKLLRERFEHKAGTVVYTYTGATYGLCQDDYLESGIKHTAVTLNPDGSIPFFTVPVRDLAQENIH